MRYLHGVVSMIVFALVAYLVLEGIEVYTPSNDVAIVACAIAFAGGCAGGD